VKDESYVKELRAMIQIHDNFLVKLSKIEYYCFCVKDEMIFWELCEVDVKSECEDSISYFVFVDICQWVTGDRLIL
jgi:hypothetical protein